jgi:hypothetical protein
MSLKKNSLIPNLRHLKLGVRADRQNEKSVDFKEL